MNAEQAEMLEELECDSAKLSGWELAFVDDLSNFDAQELTFEQDRKLREIYDRVNP